MARFLNDVSDYLTPAVHPARLVVTFARSGENRYDVTAAVDSELPTAGQFIPNPSWLLPEPKGMRGPYSSDFHQDVGAELFSALFSGSLSRSWAQAREYARVSGGLQIVIRTTLPPILALPWELLADNTLTSMEHVAISEGWSVVRDVSADGRSRRAPRQRSPIRILSLASPVPGIDQSTDADILRDAFGRDAVVVRADVDTRTLLAELAQDRVNVIHLMAAIVSGQANSPYRGVQQSAREAIHTIAGGQVIAAAASTRQLDLVVLATCETDLLAAELAAVVPAVIGIRGLISDEGCAVFLSGLYRALASGSTISQAVAAGRAQQVGFSRTLTAEWALPVLYLSHDAALVMRSGVSATPAPAERSFRSPGEGEDGATQFALQIKQENLDALVAQWEPVPGPDVPLMVKDQIEQLAREIDELGGGAR